MAGVILSRIISHAIIMLHKDTLCNIAKFFNTKNEGLKIHYLTMKNNPIKRPIVSLL